MANPWHLLSRTEAGRADLPGKLRRLADRGDTSNAKCRNGDAGVDARPRRWVVRRRGFDGLASGGGAVRFAAGVTARGSSGLIGRLRSLGARLPAPAWLLLVLVAGFAIGAGAPVGAAVLAVAGFVGGLWLDALRMTIVPLVFALVLTGVAALSGGHGAPGSVIGRRLPVVLIAWLLAAAVVAAGMTPILLRGLGIGPAMLTGLRGAIGQGAVPPVPPAGDALRALVPVNIVASASAGAIVPVVVFALILGLALRRVEPVRAEATLAPFRGLADAMIVIVGWVLRAAPVGVFALALTVGAGAGGRAALVLGGYVAIQVAVSLLLALLAYPAAWLLGGVPMLRFARAVAPAQAVAAATQSSIATLPSMLAAAARIGVPERDAAVVLPFAVAVFKVTGPSHALIVGLTLAWLAGVPVGAAQLAVAVPVAALSTLAILGVPGAVSFFAATLPTALALGAPIELLPILLAVDLIPDMVRTVANVTSDVAATAVIARAPAGQGRSR